LQSASGFKAVSVNALGTLLSLDADFTGTGTHPHRSYANNVQGYTLFCYENITHLFVFRLRNTSLNSKHVSEMIAQQQAD
jgi:hypothetical protein